MERSKESEVAKLLSSNEILRKKGGKMFASNPVFNLGAFLKNLPFRTAAEKSPNKYGDKYLFIK